VTTRNKPNIVFIGAGNLATNLAVSLFNAGCLIQQVYSRSDKSAKQLALQVHSNYTCTLTDINQDADIYFICVPDKTISEIVDKINIRKGIVVHTSGSTDISVLSKFDNQGYGIFYPFQTFSKSRIIPLSDVPICLVASNEESLRKLSKIAHSISEKVVLMDSKTLTWLHLSGVIANNFTNHLLTISHQLSIENNFSFDLLKPLVVETVQKAFENNPVEVQTGPAIRFDQTTINLHIKKLNKISPELADLYKALTLSIQSLSKKE
jgi:predicted short-subunit dehydrogenase-like oxidoreductase (DUF2520 family)